jgi:class 3 adenylate cyclase
LRPYFGYICAHFGSESRARHAFERLSENDFAEVPEPFGFWYYGCLLSETCAFLDDAPRAALLYALLLPHAERNAVFDATFNWGPVSHYLGLLAATTGHFAQAERHFEDALARSRRMKATWHVVQTQQATAEMLLARGEDGDRERALALLADVLESARERGLKRLLGRALAAKLRAQGVDPATLDGSIHVVSTSVRDRRPDMTPHAAPDGSVTLMFSVMVAFTEMTERLGDHRAREVIREHNTIVRQQLAAHGGHEVELRGDGFLLAFREPARALRCALAIQRELASRNESAEQSIRIRMGLHTGQALKDADKFFGLTVILAARIAAQAEGGEILVSAAFRELTEAESGLRFSAPREITLKGISEPQRLYAVEWH